VLFDLPKSSQRLHPFLESIAGLIRLRRESLSGLTSIDINSELLNIKGKLDGEDVFIYNEFHRARGIRKLHLEIARLGIGLEILHCVFFPDPTFDIPIFGVDVVTTPKGILAAVVDLSPVANELSSEFKNELSKISFPSFRRIRDLPDWGNIFSKYVQFIRPDGNDEEGYFLQIVDDYLRILVDSLSSIEPEQEDSASTVERFEFQQFYCIQQKRNEKTRNVLERVFNSEWADQYIDKILFDVPS